MPIIMFGSWVLNETWIVGLSSAFIGMLKGHCHEDFAALSQFCAKIITLRL